MNFADRIETEAARDAALREFDDLLDGVFWGVRRQEIEIAVAGRGREVGHLAGVDAVPGADDFARRRLPKDLGQPNDGNYGWWRR